MMLRTTLRRRLPLRRPEMPSRVRVFATTTVGGRRAASKTPTPNSLWALYCRCLERSPLLTKATMAAMIFGVSDTATQYITDDERWDGVRSASAASFGVVATTWLHYWWGFLEVVVGRRVPVQQYKLANTLVKVVLDQGIGAPLYIYSYFVMTNFLQDVSEDPTLQKAQIVWKDVNVKAADMLWPTMQQHWTLWPLVHSLNFYYTPLHHRVLVQNTVLIGWSGYLSHLNHKHDTRLMTPDEEINVAIVRRDSLRTMKQQEVAR